MPSAPLLSALVAALALFHATPTSADCSTFKQVSVLTEPQRHASPFYHSVFENQITQTSIGIACGRPDLTQQIAGPYMFHCEAPKCRVISRGHAIAYAQTNVTSPDAAADSSDTAAGRIIALALAHVSWPHVQGGKVVATATGPAGGGEFCIRPGMSGWTDFEPELACAVGVLGGCDDSGSKAETNGTPVTVCAPWQLDYPNDGVGPQLDGTIAFKSSTAKEAARRKTNPALSISGGAVTGPRAGLLVLSALSVAAALFLL